MNKTLFPSDTQVLIQGITGKEGSRMTRWLIGSGVKVVGGVTPGKAGQEVEGCPVFDTVAACRQKFPQATVSCIVVPSSRVFAAVQEAIEAGVTFINILTEQVPVHDVLKIRELANAKGVTILGPSSVGYLQFPKFRIGYIGGESPFDHVTEGGMAILSTSGGMTNELMMSLARNSFGIRVAMALGGDRVVGTTLEQAIDWVESLDGVKTLALFIEPGRPLLRALASGEATFRKPTIVFLAGEALDDLPRGMPYGHTGTILGEDDPSVREIRQALHKRGIVCVGSMSEFVTESLRLCQKT